MRVIITGGTGLIGRVLAGDLVAPSHQVVILSRRPERARRLPAGVEVVGWDGRTAYGWGHLADGAGESSTWRARTSGRDGGPRSESAASGRAA